MIGGFVHHPGVHCESTAIRDILAFHGLKLSEPMVFGLGSGLGFIYWDMKKMPFPFVGGRIQPGELTENSSKNIGFKLNVSESSSPKKAQEKLTELLNQNIPVGLKLDMYHLEYLKNPIHFAAHYVAACGTEGDSVYLADTGYEQIQRTSLKSLMNARSAKGPMSSKSLSFTFEGVPHKIDFKNCIETALHKNADSMLNPPIKNIGVKGIEKFSEEIKKWHRRSKKPERDFLNFYMMWETAGTGGAGFRNLYHSFLEESEKHIDNPNLRKACYLYKAIAEDWTKISGRIAGSRKSKNVKDDLKEISGLIKAQASREKEAMESLAAL